MFPPLTTALPSLAPLTGEIIGNTTTHNSKPQHNRCELCYFVKRERRDSEQAFCCSIDLLRAVAMHPLLFFWETED